MKFPNILCMFEHLKIKSKVPDSAKFHKKMNQSIHLRNIQNRSQLDSSLNVKKAVASQEKTKNPINHAKSRLCVKLEINYVKLKTT